MGCYISPKEETAESFLAREGSVISVDQARIASDELPVCLVDNGAFSAAGICFDRHELARFSNVADPRPKLWYMVSIARLAEVSDIKSYL
jgi:hypothetical protein